MTTQSFNYQQIIKSILAGTTDTLTFIIADRYKVDSTQEVEHVDTNLYFSGTTQVECKNTIDQLVSQCQVSEYDMYCFQAAQFQVTPDMFESYDADYDDEEAFINDIIAQAFGDSYDNIGTSDWNFRTVKYDYESLYNSILLYWRWETYVGYARRAIRLEYCIDSNLTKQHCLPYDSTSHTQITQLVTAQEVKDCAKASDLRNLIQQRIDDISLWQNSLDVDSFLCELYEDSKRIAGFYTLPENDLYNSEE